MLKKIDSNLKLSQLSSLSGIKRHTLNARLKSQLSDEKIEIKGRNQFFLKPHQSKKIIEQSLTKEKGHILYLGNLKGGVGKTTLSFLLANACSSLGLKTIVLDLDVQANMTRQYVDINTDQPVFHDVIEGKKSIQNVIIKINDSLDIIPSSLRNSLTEKYLSVQQPKHYLNWLDSICLNYLRDHYDIIVVDTPPHLSTLNSVFCLGLKEKDTVIIPVCAEEFSIMGVQMFFDDILEIRSSYKIENDVKVSIVMNRFLQNQKNNLEMLVKMNQRYEGMLSDAIIRDNAKIREIMNNKIGFSDIKNGKEIYSTISTLLQELKILKPVS